MDRKQGIIHLGRSKSPERFRSTSKNKVYTIESSKSSREKDYPKQFNVLNHSMHVKTQPFVQLINNNAKTHQGFFPPANKIAQQIVIKENINPSRVIITQSPIKRVLALPAQRLNQNSQVKIIQTQKIIAQAKQNEMQLLRKIKMLESRVQQLHEQKQAYIVKTHEQNKRINFNNNILQVRLAQSQNLKNGQINNLKQKVFLMQQESINLKNQAQSTKNQNQKLLNQVTGSANALKILRNSAYVDDSKVHSGQSHDHQIQEANIKISCLEQQNSLLKKKLSELQAQNESLVDQINQLKQSFLQNSATIESNNEKIKQNYSHKIVSLSEQIQRLNNEILQYKPLKQSLVSAQSKAEQYCQKFLQSCQQKMHIQDKYKQRISQLQNSCQNYVQQLLQKSQELMKTQDSYKCRINELQTQIKQKSSTQSCTKCKQLIKTLVKLNQKVFSKTT